MARTAIRRLAKQEAARVHSIQTLRRLRREARDEISRLIQFLDESDEYVRTELEDDISADLEDGGDTEPWLGSVDRMMNQEKSYLQRIGEYFAGVDTELDEADNEPSLGAPENHPSTPWSGQAYLGERRDLSGNQDLWYFGNACDDREHDEAESGLGDADGHQEQFTKFVL